MQTTIDPLASATSTPIAWPLSLARRMTAGMLAGAIAGVVAGGLGGRVAMRVTGLMATDAEQGTLTEAEKHVGEITLGGTIELVIFGGLLVGLIGGLLYAATSRWFAGAGGWRGLLFGAYLLAALGWTVIEGDNFDFATLGSVIVNVAMFAAIFVLFGVLIAPLYSWLATALPTPGLSVGGIASLPLYALGLLFTVMGMGLILSAFGEDGREAPFYAIIPMIVLIGALLVTAVVSRAGARFDRLSDLRGNTRALALGVLAIPLLAGLALDAQSLAEMLGEAY